MALRTVVASLALAASTAACTVQPAVPVARAIHAPAPVLVVAPAPSVVVGPVHHRPHPGRGGAHGRRHHHH